MVTSDVRTDKSYLRGSLAGRPFSTQVSDDVLTAVERYSSIDKGISALLEIGALTTLASTTLYDVKAVRAEIDRSVEKATAAVAALQDQVSASIDEDGPLAEAFRRIGEEAADLVTTAAAAQADPDAPGSLMAKIAASTQRIDTVLGQVRTDFYLALQNCVQQQTEILGKVAGEMHALQDGSALRVAMDRIDQRLTELACAIAGKRAADAESARGTAQGMVFEDLVTRSVASIAVANGDKPEHTGNLPGKLVIGRRPSLRGDVTCTITTPTGQERRIVIEAMRRQAREISVASVAKELDEGIRNRNGDAGIAVASSRDNGILLGQPLMMIKRNLWAVHLDPAEPNIVALQVAYTLARQVAISAALRKDSLDVQTLRSSVAQINAKLALLAEARAQVTNIGVCQRKAATALVEFERDIKTVVEKILESLAAQART